MPVVGMMHHISNPANVHKAYATAAVAKAEGIPFFYFSPGRVDTANERIHGFVYEDGEWKKGVFPYPDVVYNTGSPREMRKQKPIIEELKSKIPFTTSALGNKKRVYERLEKANEYREYLPRTRVIRDSITPVNFLDRYQRIVIKPVDGHKGIGIVYAEKINQEVRVVEAGSERILPTEEFQRFIKRLIQKEAQLVQPYIKSVTRNGQSYDFRLHVQKNGQGQWVFTSGYVRMAPLGTIVCNIGSGGATNYLTPFLIQEFGEHHHEIRRNLEKFALGLACHLDELHKKNYNARLDELGIDVGLDENQRIWLYEVNWRPGCPPAFYLELDVVKNSLQYALFIAKKNPKPANNA